MSDIAVGARGLSKCYRIGTDRGGALLERFMSRNGGASGRSRSLWALRDVSFDIYEGEVVGIVGHNGAGKSTLLRILSRITEPTSGRAEVRGRVASLLEVGTGFHPELTGRENVYLNGAILGMTRREIERRFDEIVQFAEVERFLDTPVKRYSSGMYVRLAFAIAAHLDPAVLIVDEVLAVGDVAFQQRCLGKMSAVAREGRTILFVSHNAVAVQTLCDRCLLLSGGALVQDGASVDVLRRYRNADHPGSIGPTWTHADDDGAVAQLRAVGIVGGDMHSERDLSADERFSIDVTYLVAQSGLRVGVTIVLYNDDDVCVLSSIDNRDEQWFDVPRASGVYVSRCHVPERLLAAGIYYVSVILWSDGYRTVAQHDKVVQFEIVESGELRRGYYGGWSGIVQPWLKWDTHVVRAPAL